MSHTAPSWPDPAKVVTAPTVPRGQALPSRLRSKDSGPADVEELAPGTPAGDYIIGARIAEGGCGMIYRAEHRLLQRPAAIKVLHRRFLRSRSMLERFVREA